jgi:hypothetical protein
VCSLNFRQTSGNHPNPFDRVANLCDAALFGEGLNSRADLSLREVLHNRLQVWVRLPYNPLEFRSAHTRFLQLFERLAGFHRLMLTNISDQNDAVLGPEACHEIFHLSCAGEAGLIHHVMFFPWCIAIPSASQKGLERSGGDAGLPQLLGRTGGGGKAFHLVSFSFRGSANGLQCGCLSCSG